MDQNQLLKATDILELVLSFQDIPSDLLGDYEVIEADYSA